MRKAGLLLLMPLAGCLGARRPAPPAALEHGGIHARVAFKGRELPNLLRHQADQIYWARVNSFGELDLDHPIETTLSKKGDCYVLDLPPGKYAPFAAAYSGLRIRFLARLDNDLRKQMTVDVTPGSFVFAGDALVRTEWEGVLAALEHSGRRILAALPPWRRHTVDITAGSPKNDRSPAAELAALRRAREVMAGTLWAPRVEERYVALGNPADPLTTGLIRKKPVAAKVAERFSYMDTLDWGQPEKIPGGLQWREPKNQARIAVTWVEYSPTRTLEGQLDRLREAGSAEDRHSLFDVRVGSLPAKGARFTTYSYDKDGLVGEGEKAHVTEAYVVGQRDGYYLLLYRARKEAFEKWRRAFADFVQRLRFLGPPAPEEKKPA